VNLDDDDPDDFAGIVADALSLDLQAFVTGYLAGCVRAGLPLDLEPHYDGTNLAPGFTVTNPRTGAAVVVSVDVGIGA
jgi:hypothetical protein